MFFTNSVNVMVNISVLRLVFAGSASSMSKIITGPTSPLARDASYLSMCGC
jgi:hypothetical protein